MADNLEFLEAVSRLEHPNGVIAFPTDTVYGLGCLPDKPDALEKIYRMKGRDQTKPLILMASKAEKFLPYLASPLPEKARELMDTYWPGALTLVLEKSEKLDDSITRGLSTVGIRIPECPPLLDLLTLLPSGLLATTSANRSGDPPCLKADEVWNTFGDDLDYVLAGDDFILDAVPSTIVSVAPDNTYQVLRSGEIVID